jgi:hypothetical protein
MKGRGKIINTAVRLQTPKNLLAVDSNVKHGEEKAMHWVGTNQGYGKTMRST